MHFRALPICAVIAFSALVFSQTIADPDFWYHLAMGRYIVEHRALISVDPFSYTSVLDSTLRELKGYWLAQVIMALVERGAGLYGEIVLRVSLLAIMLVVALRQAVRRGADVFVTLGLVGLVGIYLSYYATDRPQLYSFLFAPVLIGILDSLAAEEGGVRRRVLIVGIAVLMCLWANLHRGFPMGVALMGVYAVGETADLVRGRSDPARSRSLWIALGLGTIATLLNPNGYGTYLFMANFEGSYLQSSTVEYMSPLRLASFGVRLWPLAEYGIITLSVFLLSARRVRSAHALVAIFLGVLSLSAFRYVPFFLLVTLPFTAALASDLLARHAGGVLRLVRVCALAFMAAAALYCVRVMYPGNLDRIARAPIIEGGFPEGAVEFLGSHEVRGRLFNYDSWGGFFMWGLYPKYRVFFDTRTLSPRVFEEYNEILYATERGMRLLKDYGISVVVIPAVHPMAGRLFPLVERLTEDKEWVVVHADGASLTFARRAEGDLVGAAAVADTAIFEHVVASIKRVKRAPATMEYLGETVRRALSFRDTGRWDASAPVND